MWLVEVTLFVVLLVIVPGVPSVIVLVAANVPPPDNPLPAVIEIPLSAGVKPRASCLALGANASHALKFALSA